MLGVGVCFTLSGYLITDLLLGHWRRDGSLGLGTFWLHPARRLLPALFLLLAVMSVWVALFDAAQLNDVRRQVISAAFYFANWSTIAQHGSYFGRFAAPLPLDHLWSLSIEEQFYVVWPWLLIVIIWLAGSRAGLSGPRVRSAATRAAGKRGWGRRAGVAGPRVRSAAARRAGPASSWRAGTCGSRALARACC